MRTEIIGKNLQRVLAELGPQVTLVAVSKTFPFTDIVLAYEQGQRHFGENRVQELVDKARQAQEQGLKIHWHFVGKIQSNKLRKILAAPGLEAIHSVAKIKQIEALKKFASIPSRAVKIFLQVNTSLEQEKDGFLNLDELNQAIAQLEGFSQQLPLAGLMTMGAIRTTNFAESAKQCFSRLRELRDQTGRPLQLSMGMSRDYKIALSYGSDYVRLGEKVFGARSN